jgi:hypothetical protein
MLEAHDSRWVVWAACCAKASGWLCLGKAAGEVKVTRIAVQGQVRQKAPRFKAHPPAQHERRKRQDRIASAQQAAQHKAMPCLPDSRAIACRPARHGGPDDVPAERWSGLRCMRRLEPSVAPSHMLPCGAEGAPVPPLRVTVAVTVISQAWPSPSLCHAAAPMWCSAYATRPSRMPTR